MRGHTDREALITYLECQCSRQSPIFWNNELVLCSEALRRARTLDGHERITCWGYHIYVKPGAALDTTLAETCSPPGVSTPAEPPTRL